MYVTLLHHLERRQIFDAPLRDVIIQYNTVARHRYYGLFTNTVTDCDNTPLLRSNHWVDFNCSMPTQKVCDLVLSSFDVANMELERLQQQ